MVQPIRPRATHETRTPRAASLSFRPARDEPEHLVTHYFNTAADATQAVEAAEILDFGVRLRNEQTEIGEDTLTFTWLVEIWSDPCWADEGDDADAAG